MGWSHVVWWALDEKRNLQCPRLRQSANPGWPVRLGAAVMLVSANGGESMPEATLGIVCTLLEEKCSMWSKENMYMWLYMCVNILGQQL